MDLNEQTQQLIDRAREGDQNAIGDLYRLYEQRLHGAVRGRLGGRLKARMEPSDLVQSVWKDVLSGMHDFEYRGPDSFFHWLLTRVLWKIGDKNRYFAARKRDPARERPLAGGAEGGAERQPVATDPTPSRAAAADEELDSLMRLLDRLPSAQRQVLVLRMRDERSFVEIGRMTGRSADAARKLYNRALKRIDAIRKERDATGPPGTGGGPEGARSGGKQP